MSERQARKKRLNKVEEVKKSPSKNNLLFTVIAIVLVVAIGGLGVYAVIDKMNSKNENSMPVVNTEAENIDAVATLADKAEEMGMTADEFIAEYGLSGNPEVTADSDLYTTYGNMTVENFAKANSRPIEEIIEGYKDVEPNVTKDSIMFDLYEKEFNAQSNDNAQDTQTDKDVVEGE